MRKSIYDILGKNLNIIVEYEKLYSLLNCERVYRYKLKSYSMAEIFDLFIGEWSFRSTYRNIDEILEELELEDETTEEYAMQDILYLIELILNVNDFVEFKVKDFNKQKFTYKDTNVDLIFKENSIAMENIEIILKKLKYKSVKDKSKRIKLRNVNSDAIETAMIVEDETISDLILEFNDFRIENDLQAKKDILCSLGQFIEPLRKDIKKYNSSLEDYIFFCLNKLHIRHNNKSGKDRIEFVSKMKKQELIEWYNKVYELILISIRLINLPNSFIEFKDLKENIINSESVLSD